MGRAAVARRRVVLARYDASPKGKATAARYATSIKAKATKGAYNASQAGKDSHARYWASPKGKAMLARRCARRRIRSTNPGVYAARVQRIHELQESCNHCGITAEQIDHVIPLALGGTDDYSNLQPLCKLCHKAKTAGDMSQFFKLKKSEF